MSGLSKRYDKISTEVNNSKYKNIDSLEFEGLLIKFANELMSFHIYSVDRLCMKGSVLGYEYDYQIIDASTIRKSLYLGEEYGTLYFVINIENDSASISIETRERIEKYLEDNDYL